MFIIFILVMVFMWSMGQNFLKQCTILIHAISYTLIHLFKTPTATILIPRELH